MPDWVSTRRRAIGARTREARLDAQMSRLDLGHRVGRDHKTVHRYETAATAPCLTELLLIADAIGVPLRDLVG